MFLRLTPNSPPFLPSVIASVKLRLASKEATRCNSCPFFRLSGLVYRVKPRRNPGIIVIFPSLPPWTCTSISNLFLPRLLPSFPTSLIWLFIYLWVPLSLSLSARSRTDILVLVYRRAVSLLLSLSICMHVCVSTYASLWCRFLSLLACTNYIYTEGRTELELKGCYRASHCERALEAGVY